MVAQVGFAPLQAAVPALWQPVQALVTQKPFAGFSVQPVLSVHSTHCPAAGPVVAQTKAAPPSTVAAHRVAVQAVQTLFTQKPLAGLAEQPVLSTHSTHWPEVAPEVAHTGLVPLQAAVPAF